MVEEITNHPETKEEEYMTQKIAEGHPTVDQKRKTQVKNEITIPHILDFVVTKEEMLGKVPKLRYSYHDVRNTNKFPDLDEGSYLVETKEIGPLGRPIMEPM